MPFLIQRVPRGLQNVLSLQSGETPMVLGDNVVGALELLQFYGNTQLQSGNSSGNPAAGAQIVVNFPGFGTPQAPWCVLFAAWCSLTKTATMTALRASLYYRKGGTALSSLIASAELGPFGATETGNADIGGVLPYPILMPPQSSVLVVPTIIGTDATVGVNLVVEFGVLG